MNDNSINLISLITLFAESASALRYLAHDAGPLDAYELQMAAEASEDLATALNRLTSRLAA